MIDPAADLLGRAYLLYTVGSDGVDNDGQRAVQAQDALNDREPGTDFVFNALPDE